MEDEGADVNLTTRGVLLREKQAAMNAPSLNVDVVSIAATTNPHNTITNIKPKLPATEMNNTCQIIYIRWQFIKIIGSISGFKITSYWIEIGLHFVRFG